MVDRKKNICNLLRQLQGFSLVLFISVIFQENKPETGLAFGESRGKCKLPPRQGERLLLWYGQLLKQALFSPSPRPKSNGSVQEVRNREGCRQIAVSHQLPHSYQRTPGQTQGSTSRCRVFFHHHVSEFLRQLYSLVQGRLNSQKVQSPITVTQL